ncbi:MAG: alpha/beta hydrolase [Pseudomonadota bacterium]
MEAAPLKNDVAEGPRGGAAYWLTTEDEVRIRIAVWPEGGSKGTIFIFPGRTEYAEKYGRAASEFQARGWATVSVDWRGQGLADRLLPDRRIGHVDRFLDFQLDVAAVMQAGEDLDLPRPWYMLGHSMGGCIGLRAMMNGLDIEACAFSAPMWGIRIMPALRPLAWTMGTVLPPIGLGNGRSPGANDTVYVLEGVFDNNTLTNDLEMWEYMGRQAEAEPQIALGAPSIRWLGEALREMRALSKMEAPDKPCVCFLGTNERIVDMGRIRTRMANWPRGRLIEFKDAEHEVLMEEPSVRKRVFDECAALFEEAVPEPA